ncbi:MULTISPECIES: BolA family protein [Pseudanabaena]|uniref:Transcriptional regulator, BolA protein family n=2 Tax=Pseudanabaena TaxID=1152 RepID=L8N5P7_9CYAN|nr:MULTISPECIES: BolA family protein [Pseudanabaena]ELS33543.1 transcriptional regulator, BolA protein family [Pseudanabaena biceps PCC 7429]MDG3494246.1 BolA family transcriptional regulator [Pseudanabaena catenata USMAC16]
MNVASTIKTILQEKIGATVVEIEDRSDLHKHHQGRMNAPVGSGHYDAIVVASGFTGKTMMQQHRMVYAALEDQMQTTIHALSLKTYTLEQWSQLDH